MNDLMTQSFLSYVELKKQAQKDLEMELDVESGRLNPTDHPNLGQFFQEANGITLEMEEITNLLFNLQTLNEETKSVHSAKVLRGLRDQIESDIVAVLRKARVVKARLESLHRSNISSRKISELYREGSHIDRTRTSVTSGMRVKLRQLMNEFQVLREKIVTDFRNDLKKRYYNETGEEPSEDMIEKMISGGGGIQTLTVEKEVDSKSKERHEAVMDIQRSLQKLHQVFLDMAVLVETQGEKIDDIEDNVASAGNFISGGTNNIYYVNQMKKKKKAWLYWLWAVISIILLVCIISMLVS
ncbi:hypothetical protein K2173_006019 [Erythroxylum novogranatense]|uniref:t-SNARE coiled-coil homology domain-containing protein n=1 Tax=Erythroxylum novogranatense TaxID=1862640 RepID=A0AAV8TE48_9ROSI|nr:hypothetical protein K2173_006019 [Erythroxylum novogranatense]